MNNDLISRSALYRKIKTECNPYGKPTIDFESGKRVLKLIDNAPTVTDEIIATIYDKYMSCDGQIHNDTANEIIKLIKENKPKQGEWIIQPHSMIMRCSLCENEETAKGIGIVDTNKHFCSNCGADMRKGGAE